MADNHGNTPAAWTAVLVALVGFVVGAIGMSTSPLNWALFWIGCALVVGSAVVFAVLAKLGLHSSGH
ncbi:HGxxPAAW family protein [Nocardioides sp. SYSU DS0651]|uniref:HGxxPAAW family protein n=1 Tax=Nocardioides sp. SYSU DS0651 TaxID=3415955 RepID=UPI003F4C1DB6